MLTIVSPQQEVWRGRSTLIVTGDALEIAVKHNIKLKDAGYVQIYPTSLYLKNSGRKFLVSESVRGEGALLYDKILVFYR